ncbi:hypothetical protein A4U88_4837 [Serratia marcescens]|nr:hypothetical protein A4U88_4837 [Serratia marcescens]
MIGLNYFTFTYLFFSFKINKLQPIIMQAKNRKKIKNCPKNNVSSLVG